MARSIEAFKLRTELSVDNAKFSAGMKTSEKDVDKLGARFAKLGPEIDKALKGKELGTKFGQSFSSSATASITGSFDTLGQTLGSIIGTAIAPGIGTAIGSTLGSGFDKIAGTVLGTIGPLIQRGIDLNKVLESTTIEFTTFVGSEKEAKKYLAELVQLSGDIGILPTTLIETSEKLYDLTGNLKLTRSLLKAAADQAQDFGGSVETFQKIADVLGLIAEKGNLSKREIQQLYKVGINVPKILAEAFGKTPKQIEQLMAAGRIRGEIAAGLVAASIEREKSGYAALQARTSTSGIQRRNESLTMIRAAEGTKNATNLIRDFYSTTNDVLSSPQAQQFVKFIDEKTGSLINLVEKASRAGVNVAEGLGSGITSGDALKSLSSSFSTLGSYTEKTLKGVFEIQSPSERTAREIGEPMGEGLGVGMTRRFTGYMAGEGRDQIVLTLEGILQDPKVRAFFEAIKKAEGGAPNRIVGGRTISDLSHHPNIVGLRTAKGPSTAAGSYQITGSNWYGTRGRPGLQPELGLPDFSAHSQDLAALKLFMDRDHGAGLRALQGGDIKTAIGVAAKDWTSTPGSTIGGGGQRSMKQWMGYYNQALGVNGSAITDSNPMPVYVAHDIKGGAFLLGQGDRRSHKQPTTFSTSVSFDENSIEVDQISGMLALSKSGVDLLKDLAPAIADTKAPLMSFEKAMQQWGSSAAAMSLGMHPLTEEQKRVGDASIDLKAKVKELEQEFGVVGIAAEDLIGKLSGALGQAAGFLPQQTVGKKRGLFSKILGFAAPFLSFIPGAGPMLSHLAGMASAGLAGNWAGVATGLAGGLQPGGVFRGSGGGGGTGGAGTILGGGAGTTGHSAIGHRAMGGPVRRGQPYVVGEQRPELFIPNSDGWIHPRVGGQSGGGDGMMTRFLAALDQHSSVIERQNSFLARLEGMDPTHVVRLGARGMIDAYDQDAGLIRLSSQRHRLE
jgi:tape measure domain-containing protein